MLANRLLVQKLDNNGSIMQSWTVEPQDYSFCFNYVSEEAVDNYNIFPVEPCPSLKMLTTPVGEECVYKIDEKKKIIYFSELYSVPEGMIISVILPKGYKPVSMGFSESAHIPNLAPFTTIESPGYIYIKYLPKADIIVLSFKIVKSASFKFSFTAVFDIANNNLFEIDGGTNNYLWYSMRYARTDGSVITENDLQLFNSYFSGSADLNKIAEGMNKLLSDNTTEEEKNKVAKSISERLSGTIGTVSNITTLLGFYIEHKNSIDGIIAAILMFLQFNFCK